MITIESGSILDFEGDAIVNPANSFLRHGAGLAKIIADAATPVPQPYTSAQTGRLMGRTEMDSARSAKALWWKEQHAHPLIPTGSAGWTSAGALPYKGIVHAVGPIWGGGHFCERTLLASAHAQAFFVADQHHCRSIAVPAISCGLFGYPAAQAAQIAIDVAMDVWSVPQPDGLGMDITFYPFGFEAEYEAALRLW